MPEPVVRRAPEATGAAAIARRAVPDAASHHPIGTGRGPLRIGHFIVGIDAEPVLAPLLDIAMHVIETPGIGLFPGYRLNHIIRVATIPPYRIQIGVSATIELRNTAVEKSGRASRPAGIFPFSFGRKPVRIGAFFLVEFLNEFLDTIP